MPDPVRLLLVDSSPLLRSSLAALLNRKRTIRVIGQAASGAEAVAQAVALRPDVALVEPEIPDGGPALITQLSQEPARCAALVLTGRRDDASAAHYLQAGARGYLQKDCQPEELVVALRRVSRGELVIAPAASDTVLKGLSGESTRVAAVARLSGRETEVLQLVAQGLTNAQIARALSITEYTVKGHLVKLLGKLGLDNRVQLATYALQHGVVTSPAGGRDRTVPGASRPPSSEG